MLRGILKTVQQFVLKKNKGAKIVNNSLSLSKRRPKKGNATTSTTAIATESTFEKKKKKEKAKTLTY